MVLTVKNMLAAISRRAVNGVAIDHTTLEALPVWLPATFDLKTEIPHFVSYFQHREARYESLDLVENYQLTKTVGFY